MATSSYPVVRETALDAAQRRIFGRSRDMAGLPTAEPGTVLVFEVPNGYVAFTERRHLRGREDLVVEAVSVSQVSVRPRSIVVQVSLPSRSAADEFSVLVDFRCRVEDPEVVAAAGLTDLTGPLRAYLRQDSSLGQIASTRSIEEINDIRQEIDERIRAHCSLRPPRIDGMSIRLQGVRVLTPTGLATHERNLRDKVWQHRVQELENQYEDANATRLRPYFEEGPSALAGLATSRGELDLATATAAAHEQEAQRLKVLMELLKSLPPEVIDTMPIDTTRIFESLVDKVAGPAPAGRAIDQAPSPQPEFDAIGGPSGGQSRDVERGQHDG